MNKNAITFFSLFSLIRRSVKINGKKGSYTFRGGIVGVVKKGDKK